MVVSPDVPFSRFQEGRAEEAVADLSRAVEMSDSSPASLHYLAKALKVGISPAVLMSWFRVLLRPSLSIKDTMVWLRYR